MARRTAGAAAEAVDYSALQTANDTEGGEMFADYITRAGGDIGVFDADRDSGPAPSENPAEAQRPGTRAPAAPATDEDEEGAAPESRRDEDDPDAGDEPDDGQASGDDDDDASGDAEEGLEVATLAAVLGVDESQLIVDENGQLSLATTVDGERGKATLADLLKGYQTEAAITRRSQQFAEERRQQQEQLQQRQQELASAIQNVAAVGEALRGRVMARYDSVDWAALRRDDPGESAALQQEMQNELRAIDVEVYRLQQQANAEMQKAQQEQHERFQQWLQEQQEQTFAHIPQLADAQARGAVLQSYQDYLTGYGFTPQEVQGILDHRYLRVVDDAVKYRKLMADKGAGGDPTPVQKRLVKVPRIGKAAPSGGREGARPGGNRRVRALQRLQRTGSDEAAVQYALDSGLVDSILGD